MRWQSALFARTARARHRSRRAPRGHVRRWWRGGWQRTRSLRIRRAVAAEGRLAAENRMTTRSLRIWRHRPHQRLHQRLLWIRQLHHWLLRIRRLHQRLLRIWRHRPHQRHHRRLHQRCEFGERGGRGAAQSSGPESSPRSRADERSQAVWRGGRGAAQTSGPERSPCSRADTSPGRASEALLSRAAILGSRVARA